MDLQDYRMQINEIDERLTELFAQRMQVAAGIAEYKKANGLPVLDSSREEQKLQSIAESLPEELKGYGVELYKKIMELSRSYQEEKMNRKDEVL